jgi:hypothetical protein
MRCWFTSQVQGDHGQQSRVAGLIMHSDRGSQYCGKDFTRAIKAYGVQVSNMPPAAIGSSNAILIEFLGTQEDASRMTGTKLLFTRTCHVQAWRGPYDDIFPGCAPFISDDHHNHGGY